MMTNNVVSPSHRTIARKRRLAATAVAAAAMIIGSSLTASQASAASAFDPNATEQILRQAGAVAETAAPTPVASKDLAVPDAAREPSAAASTAQVTLKSGLSVTTGSDTLEIRPVASGAKALSSSGLAVYQNTAESTFAMSKASTGGNAGYAVITGASAPTDYRFLFTVNGKPATLKLNATGGVDVYNSAGAIVNMIVPAWAKDANGAAVPTSYSVAGNILTQRVEHAGAAYPVVADPRARCDGLWCTMEYTRAETARIADNILTPTAGCALIPYPASAICVTVMIGAWAQANIARNTGQCIGFRVWQANLVSYPHLAYIRCYA
jgi:hypothetical protein